jgi:hypothetical protein
MADNILFGAHLSMPFSPENREIPACGPSRGGSLKAAAQKFRYPRQYRPALLQVGLVSAVRQQQGFDRAGGANGISS